MIRIALFGGGRIGRVHARAVTEVAGAEIALVCDPFVDSPEEIAPGARAATVEEALADPGIGAVIIASPTGLHAEQIEASARAGKAIFCEKPIDLSAERARACLEVVRATGAFLMMGFNRRFDPNFAELRRRLQAGAIGATELVQITSRDPSQPPPEYVASSGGLFRDMMIHDFDMARFLLGEEVQTVSASGSSLVDPAIGDAGDVDTATATLRTASGKICMITNSRRASYGYDQRVEVHGAKGMLSAENMRPTTVVQATAEGYRADPLLDFFMQRYESAYRLELEAFLRALKNGEAANPSGEDGVKALELADAADQSMREGRAISVE